MTPSIRTYCVSIIAAKNTLLMEKPSNDQLETLRRLRLSTRVRCRVDGGKTDASICSNQPASVKRKTPYEQRECRHATSEYYHNSQPHHQYDRKIKTKHRLKFTSTR
jgi:hypothetical protein